MEMGAGPAPQGSQDHLPTARTWLSPSVPGLVGAPLFLSGRDALLLLPEPQNLGSGVHES